MLCRPAINWFCNQTLMLDKKKEVMSDEQKKELLTQRSALSISFEVS